MEVHCLGMTYVKCTGFLTPASVSVDHGGIIGDRQFMLLDQHDQAVAPHHHGLFTPLKFEFDAAGNTLRLHYPDGGTIFAPLDLSEDIIEVDYLGLRKIALRKVLGPWDDRLSEFSGRLTRLCYCERPGSGVDILPLTVLTTGALRELERHIGAAVDPRRFRANLIIENHSDRADEDGWDGRHLRIGKVLLRVRSSVPRCIVTQFNPNDGTEDAGIVNVLGKYRPKTPLPDNIVPSYTSPGFASYAEVVEPGSISIGDRVELL